MKVSGTSAAMVTATAMVVAVATGVAADSGVGLRATHPDAATTAVGFFLASNGPDAEDAREIRNGAEIAVQECAGRAGECVAVAANGTGKWDAGAGELVRLVYTEGVKAVLGAADGRTAHLAEQVVTRAKGRFVLLTPWASDPTLTQIRVPWFFRLAPDDRRQAEALIEEMRRAGVRQVVALVAETSYDLRAAAAAFEKAARAPGAPAFHKITLQEERTDLDAVAAEVRAAGAEAILFLDPPELAAGAARQLRQAGISAPFFGPLRLASPEFIAAAGSAAEGMILAAPPEASGPAAERFRARYRQVHNRECGALAAYGYDGAALLIEALRSTGGEGGESLRAALAVMHRDGVTGRIEFDASGNRAGSAPLARVEHGQLGRIPRNGSDSKQAQPIAHLLHESLNP
ncbi:MAG TPA: branched-chain amino acid ABC transporter substrate-binding protein [Candidatus Binatia bacterium]